MGLLAALWALALAGPDAPGLPEAVAAAEPEEASPPVDPADGAGADRSATPPPEPDPLGADPLGAAGVASGEGAPPPGVRVVPERWTVPEEVIDAVRAVATWPLGERMAAATAAFLGLPYAVDAAGELAADDPDPPARYDTFDCLTFVEEALALTLAADPLDAPRIRNALRYEGAPTYANRRHFMEQQWVPAALANGFLVDITDRVGRARTVTHEVTPETWRHWRRRGLFDLPAQALPTGSWTLRYLDLAEAERAVPHMPPGAVLLTVRVPRTWSPIAVTHISLVLPGGKMRHATRMGARKVRDDRLDWYVRHLRDYVNWPSLGVAVLLPREQGPRVSALQPFVLPEPQRDAEGPLPAFVPTPIPPYPPLAAVTP